MTREQIISHRNDLYARFRAVLEHTSAGDYTKDVETLGVKASLADRTLDQIRHPQAPY